jgi:hypothetical protein
MNPTLEQIAAGTNVHTVMNELFDATSVAGAYGKRHAVTTGLTWGYYGSIYNGVTVADGTATLTDNATNYLVAHRTTGAVSVATTTTNWTNTTTYAKLYKVTTASGLVTDEEDHRLDTGGLFNTAATPTTQAICIAAGDETTALTTGTAKVTFRMPFAFTLTAVRASVTTAPTGATLLQVDINEAGVSILSTKLTFDASEKTTTTAATPAVISDTSLADDAEITIDIDAVGNTIAGAGLKVYLIGTKT